MTHSASDDEPSVASPGLQLDRERLLDLFTTEPQLIRAWRREPETDATRHALYDVLLAEGALRHDWTPDAIIALIQEGNTRNALPAPNHGFCLLTMQEARLRTQTGDLDLAREKLLDNLADIWGLHVEAVIKHGTENAFWHLRLQDGREIQLGTSQDLQSQTKVRARIYDVTGQMIPRYAPKELRLWDHHMEILALVAMTVDTPEMTRRGQARSLLLGYLQEEYCPLDHDASPEEWEALALGNRPFMRNGMLHIAVKDIWVKHIRLLEPQMSQREFLDLLRLLGGKRIRVTINHPSPTSRSVWRLAPEQLSDDRREDEEISNF